MRGWSGSGKSAVVLKLLNQFSPVTVLFEDKKVVAYRLNEIKERTYVIGPYSQIGGGCDCIHPVSKIEELVRKFTARGSVVFEGQMISTIAGRWAELAKSMPECKFIFLVLDTPLEKCLARIRKRRRAKGNHKPFNPKPSNLKHFDEARYSSPENLRKAGMDVRIIDHKKAYEYILHLLGE